MGRNRKKILRDFIDSIPDSKLTGFPDSQNTLYKDVDLRLDMQCVSSHRFRPVTGISSWVTANNA
jgi:hypothetical protein